MTVGAQRKKEWARISRDRYIETAPRSEATEEAAFQAEAFFGDRYGLKPNRVVREDGGLEPLEEGDFLIPRDGKRTLIIDVKSTKYDNGSVITWLDARVRADIYVLVPGKAPNLRIAGWAYGDKHRTRVRDTKHGTRHVTYQSELEPQSTDDLMSYLGFPPRVAPIPAASSHDSFCYACRKVHDREFLCRPMTEYLWAIIKGGKRDSKAWRWARVVLGLDEARV